MEYSNKRSWHLEIAEATKLKPHLVSNDIFFQFKRNQPFQLKKTTDKVAKKYDKPPRVHTHYTREFSLRPSTHIRLRPDSQCSGRKITENNDSFNSKSSLDTYKIEKNSAKILHELGRLFDKENRDGALTPTDLSWKEKADACKEYRHVSQRISMISRGRIPLKNIKVEMYRKDH